MDIDQRKQRLDEAADAMRRERLAWHGETGDLCPSCGVLVPAGFRLELPQSNLMGCLRCLEQQAHIALGGVKNLPLDLASVGGQVDAQRQVAEDFRAHIKAAERGREPPSRRKAQAQWTARSGWEETAAFDAPDPRERPSRWPERGARAIPRPAPQAASKRARPDPWPGRRSQSKPGRRARPEPSVAIDSTGPSPAEILGLSGRPTRDEIVAAFRRCARVCHPDNGGSADAFREIVEARDALLAEVS